MLKTLLGVAVGAVAGAVAGYVIARKKFDEEIEVVCNEYEEKIKRMKETAKEETKETVNYDSVDIEPFEEKAEEETAAAEESRKNNIAVDYSEGIKNHTYIDYTKYSREQIEEYEEREYSDDRSDSPVKYVPSRIVWEGYDDGGYEMKSLYYFVPTEQLYDVETDEELPHSESNEIFERLNFTQITRDIFEHGRDNVVYCVDTETYVAYEITVLNAYPDGTSEDDFEYVDSPYDDDEE